jgi:hypothetical protein
MPMALYIAAMVMRMRSGTPTRAVTDVGPGDFVQVVGSWEKILSNTAFGKRLPRDWTIVTREGMRGMFDVDRYAKAEDFEEAAAG